MGVYHTGMGVGCNHGHDGSLRVGDDCLGILGEVSMWLRQWLCWHKWISRGALFSNALGAWIAQEECVKCGKLRSRIKL